ncbi:MAG: rhomboid family intramembrane serine protease [Gammaproteobacteria bacterium]
MSPKTTVWVVVHETADARRASEAALVLTALEIKHERRMYQNRWQLSVAEQDAARASEEIRGFDEERHTPPVGRRPIQELGNGWNGVAAYAGFLLIFAILQAQGALGLDWVTAGRLDAGRVIAGEWWRAVTALTLHADLGHLASNIAFGSFFGLYVGRYLGSGLGWSAILAGGILGNVVNAWIQPPSHLAIGASTAVFAALGLLGAYTWRRGFLKNTPWRDRIAPVTAAVFLLAFTGSGSGTGDGNVDVMAHLTGFAAGFGLGVWLAASRIPEGVRAQQLAAGISACMLLGAWLTAFGAAVITR